MRQMRKAQTIKQVLPITNGLFTKMNYNFLSGISKSNLDLMFISNYGLRNPAPIVETIQGTYGEKLTSEELTMLAGSIVEMYKDRWNKLGGIYAIEYDPIHNYLDEWEDTSDEVLDGESSRSESASTTYGKTQTETIQRTDNLTERNVYEEDTTSTRTDDLTKTETRNLEVESTRTDNLTEEMSYGKTDTRTDNLSEEVTYGKVDTRTDNLTESKTYGKTDTRTDNLASSSSETHSDTDSGSNDDTVHAFNASTALPTTGSTSSNTNSGSVSISGTNTGTVANVESGTDGKTNTGTQATATTGSDEKTNTGTVANVLSGSDEKTNTGTRTTVNADTGTVTTADEGTEQTVGEKDSTNTKTNTGTRNTTDQISFGGLDSTSKSGSSTQDVTTTRDRSGRHFGNIGNLTSQKQILEEINLWKWNYMNEILSDVKEFCTLPVYLNASEWQLVDQDEDN